MNVLWLTLKMRKLFSNTLHYMLFYISNTFMSKAGLKLAKN